jgi:antitoxin component of MazEF toxin-antitoxin module
MPKHWIEGMNLEPGDKVEVLYDQDVTIRATKRGADKK